MPTDSLDLALLRQVVLECGARFAWEAGQLQSEDDTLHGIGIVPVGPKFARDDDEDPPETFDENTLLEVWHGEYDGPSVARFVSTFDPPTVERLIEMAALRDEALYQQVGILDGRPIYRRTFPNKRAGSSEGTADSSSDPGAT